MHQSFPVRLQQFMRQHGRLPETVFDVAGRSRPSEPASAGNLSQRSEVRDPFDAYTVMAPQYAYGRHRGPSPRFSYPAAVAIVLIPLGENRWAIPLTVRPAQMQDHAGQVSLPGGRAERKETTWQTASREYSEELGVPADSIEMIGELPALYVYASKHRVLPVIAYGENHPAFVPNADEVAEVLMLPLTDLLQPDAVQVATMQKGTFHYQVPGFWAGQHFVWGATAMILAEFRTLALRVLHEEPS